jgi:hypothetical protein
VLYFVEPNGKLRPTAPSLQLPHRLTHAGPSTAFDALFIALKSPEGRHMLHGIWSFTALVKFDV